MKQVLIYTSGWCGYCSRAKSLLKKKGVTFTEIDVSSTPGARREMEARAHGQHSVPQIFIGETHVGGFDDLHVLEAEGRLDALLA